MEVRERKRWPPSGVKLVQTNLVVKTSDNRPPRSTDADGRSTDIRKVFSAPEDVDKVLRRENGQERSAAPGFR
jgi:hypothetical protein